MSGFSSVLCLIPIVIFTSWIVSKVFSFIYLVVVSPVLGVVWGAQKFVPEEYQEWTFLGLSMFTMLIGYYLACIWPAYIISWIIIPNLYTAPWWLYGIAFGGFYMSVFANRITFIAFAVFCFKPELIKSIYGWIPFIF